MNTNSKNISLDIATVSVTGIDAQISEYFELDRYLGDVLTLPYTYEEVKIASNELCVADNINACLFKLHYNFLYINSKTKVATNNFPTRYKGFITSSILSTSADVIWHLPTVSTQTLSAHLSAGQDGTVGTILSGLVDGVFTESIGPESKYVGFVANSGTLLAIETLDTNSKAGIRLNKKTIEDAAGMTFTNIKALALNSEKQLFVVDDMSIHKFDVDAVLTDNLAVSGIGRFLIKTIGGKSRTIYDKDKFANPVNVAVGKDDKVYVLDADDNGFKIYDKDLNWIYTASRKLDFTTLSGAKTVDIAVDTEDEHIYVLSENGVVLRYDSEYKLYKKYILDDPIELDETYRRLTLSQRNDNVMYALTNKSLLKKFKSRITKSIGAFRLKENKITTSSLAFVDVLQTDNPSFDYVFLGGNWSNANMASDAGMIFKFDERVEHKTIVYDAHKLNLYALSAINVVGDEYVTSWVINKAFYKMIYNHLLFRDNLHLKYVGTYDNVGRLQYAGTNYITDVDNNLFGYTAGLDHFVGINEPVLAETINRPLKKIHDLQESLLHMCREKVTNKYPYSDQVQGVGS